MINKNWFNKKFTNFKCQKCNKGEIELTEYFPISILMGECNYCKKVIWIQPKYRCEYYNGEE